VHFLRFAEQLYEEMIRCKTKDRGYYSAHFVSLQKKFVKHQLQSVKHLILLVKYWRKTCIEDKGIRKTKLPSSYQLELITIACWEKAGKPESFDFRVGFAAVLQQLVDNCYIDFTWYEYYDEALAQRGINGMEKKNKRFVFVPIQGKSQARPGQGGDAHIKAMGVIIVPFTGAKFVN